MSVSSGPGATRQRQSKGERERAAPTGPRRTTADGAVERLAVTIALQKQSAKSQDKKNGGGDAVPLWESHSWGGTPLHANTSSPTHSTLASEKKGKKKESGHFMQMDS